MLHSYLIRIIRMDSKYKDKRKAMMEKLIISLDEFAEKEDWRVQLKWASTTSVLILHLLCEYFIGPPCQDCLWVRDCSIEYWHWKADNHNFLNRQFWIITYTFYFCVGSGLPVIFEMTFAKQCVWYGIFLVGYDI